MKAAFTASTRSRRPTGRFNKQGLTINDMTPPELTAMMRRETERWSRIVKEKGLKGE